MKQMIGLSITAIVIAGCGGSNTLSERDATTSSTSPDTSTDTTSDTTSDTASDTASEEEINYVIKAKSQNLTSVQQEVLKVHNERRKNDFSDSDLSYSLALEEVAQAYADVLAENGKQEHDANNAKNGYGENIFAHSTDKNIQIEDAMRVWYDNEKAIYNYDTSDCNTSAITLRNDAQATCGHYTQVAWQETKEVGCASAIYTDKNSSYFGGSVYVCKYKDAGNVGTQKPYCANYVTNDIYTGTIPTINTSDITAKNLEIELVEEDRVNCTRTDNRNGSINFAKSFKSAQLIDFDIFNGTKYTATFDFNSVTIVDNMVKLTGTGLATEKFPIFMNIKFVGETSEYYGVELEWNGHNTNDKTLSRSMKAKLYK